ncbi:hypothetical protein BLNAU_12717 [Blattamonas nauphoetae]|uniref:Uncharacterized protein n=1 Tax=Blattamonas nauphoetae TaxID=2049346 RepID=A0ABQ9XLW8_9EUKA|nr:hypothetical protein BLNAU_12717 [Blattamonas nauphoetae]
MTTQLIVVETAVVAFIEVHPNGSVVFSRCSFRFPSEILPTTIFSIPSGSVSLKNVHFDEDTTKPSNSTLVYHFSCSLQLHPTPSSHNRSDRESRISTVSPDSHLFPSSQLISPISEISKDSTDDSLSFFNGDRITVEHLKKWAILNKHSCPYISQRNGDEVVVFVCGTTGTDGEGCGSEASPCKTIGGGYDELSDPAEPAALLIISNCQLNATLQVQQTHSLTLSGGGSPLPVVSNVDNDKISVSEGTLTIRNISFNPGLDIHNSFLTFHNKGTLTITGCSFTGFDGKCQGPVLSASMDESAIISITNTTFSNTRSSKNGGVLFIKTNTLLPSTSLTVQASFIDCTVDPDCLGDWVYLEGVGVDKLVTKDSWTGTFEQLTFDADKSKLWTVDTALSEKAYSSCTMLVYLLDYSGESIWVSSSEGKDVSGCGEQSTPCLSLFTAIDHLTSSSTNCVTIKDSTTLDFDLHNTHTHLTVTRTDNPRKQVSVESDGKITTDDNQMTFSYLSFTTSIVIFSDSLITITDTASLSLTHCAFSSFHSSHSGSIVSASLAATSSLSITDCSFTSCISSEDGGVLHIACPASLPNSSLIISSSFDSTCTCSQGKLGQWVFLSGSNFLSLIEPNNWKQTYSGLTLANDSSKLWGYDYAPPQGTAPNETFLSYLVRYVNNEIFLSPKNGRDSLSCGTAENSCQTLPYALQKVSESSDSTLIIVDPLTLETIFTSPDYKLVVTRQGTQNQNFSISSNGQISVSTENADLFISFFNFNISAPASGSPFSVSQKGSLTITSSSVEQFVLSNSPSLISITNEGALKISESSFKSCEKCIAASSGSIVIESTNFSSCVIKTDHLISLSSESSETTSFIKLTNCYFENMTRNSSQSDCAVVASTHSITVEGCHFTSCTKTKLTALSVQGSETSKPTVTLSQSTFDSENDSILDTGRFIAISTADTVHFSHTNFSNFQSSYDGCVLFLLGAKTVTFDSLTVSNISTQDEGLFTIKEIEQTIKLSSSNLTQTTSQFSTFVVDNSYPATMTITSSKFRQCIATVGSGVLYCTTNFICKDCQFNDCYGIYAADSIFIADMEGIRQLAVDITDCSFEGPGSDIRRRGACLSFQNTTSVSLKSLSFKGIHTQSIQGGAVMCRATRKLVCESCNFTQIQSSFGSGMYIYEVEESVIIRSSNFTTCTSSQRAGAISLRFAITVSTFTVTDCSFHSCSSLMSAGAIIVHSETASVSDTLTVRTCTFTNCSFTNCSSLQGGALHLVWNSVYPPQKVVVNNTTFTQNTVSNSGGSIYVEEKFADSSTLNASLVVQDSQFSSNICQNKDKWDKTPVLLETICGGAIYAYADIPNSNVGDGVERGREEVFERTGNGDSYHIVVSGSTFVNNMNTSIAVYYSSALVSSSSFSDNTISFNSKNESMSGGCRTAKLHMKQDCTFSPMENLLCNQQCNLNNPSPEGFFGCNTVSPSNLVPTLLTFNHSDWPNLPPFQIKADNLLDLAPKAMITAEPTSAAENYLQFDVQFSTGSKNSVIIPNTNLSHLRGSVPKFLYFYLSSDGGNTWSSDAATVEITQPSVVKPYVFGIIGGSIGAVALTAAIIIILCCVNRHRKKTRLDRWHRMQKGYQELVTASYRKDEESSAYYDY